MKVCWPFDILACTHARTTISNFSIIYIWKRGSEIYSNCLLKETTLLLIHWVRASMVSPTRMVVHCLNLWFCMLVNVNLTKVWGGLSSYCNYTDVNGKWGVLQFLLMVNDKSSIYTNSTCWEIHANSTTHYFICDCPQLFYQTINDTYLFYMNTLNGHEILV